MSFKCIGLNKSSVTHSVICAVNKAHDGNDDFKNTALQQNIKMNLIIFL